MASERRIQRLNKTLMKEISQIILFEMKDPRLTSMVSVLEVSISKDLQFIKVIVSIFGENEKNNMKSLQALNHASGYISSVVSKNLRMRTAPDILFVKSDSIKKGMDIYYKLKDLKNDTDQDLND